MPLGDGEDVGEHLGGGVVVAEDRQAVREQAVEVRLVPEGGLLLFSSGAFAAFGALGGRAPVRRVCAGALGGARLLYTSL
ncbi:hypothetical protein VR46_22735, partial [Streptomyces sp. NRRL S-444]